jgi:hypothetical protein
VTWRRPPPRPHLASGTGAAFRALRGAILILSILSGVQMIWCHCHVRSRGSTNRSTWGQSGLAAGGWRRGAPLRAPPGVPRAARYGLLLPDLETTVLHLRKALRGIKPRKHQACAMCPPTAEAAGATAGKGASGARAWCAVRGAVCRQPHLARSRSKEPDFRPASAAVTEPAACSAGMSERPPKRSRTTFHCSLLATGCLQRVAHRSPPLW